MSTRARNLVILGSTGSIGRSTLEVVEAHPDHLQVTGLSAHSQLDLLCEQARNLHPRWFVATDEETASTFDWSQLEAHSERLHGADGMRRMVTEDDVDIVVSAIVGSAGLISTWDAIGAGKTVALANKETLVVAGPLVMQRAAACGSDILPLDSEHSAVFQALQAGRREDVKKVILTASGGPFRKHSSDELSRVTVAEALNHPTWDMGPKITVDSATMMNKALEIVEARWLFDLQADQIEVVIHPQSIVHSLVEFKDGSLVAQMSTPDMKLPIQYALTYPERRPCPAPSLDLSQAKTLDFEAPDRERFPALDLGFEVAESGGTTGAVLNAANEAAVAGFLGGQLGYTQIVPACRSVLDQHNFDPNPTLEQLLELDAWAREEVTRWVCS